MKKVKLICAAVSIALLASTVYAQAADVATNPDSSAPTWESEKLARQQAKEVRAAEQAAKKQAALEKKLAAMSAEDRAAYEAKEAEKAAIAAEKQAEKERVASEKKAAKEAADAEKKAAKEAALNEKLAAMTPEQRAKYDEKEALKAQIKAERDEEFAMRKATIEQTKAKANVPYFTVDIEEGLELTKVSRVILKQDRSNFVFTDTLAGAYVNVKTNGFEHLNPVVKLSALMGLGETFNNMKVKTSTFNYGLDGFLGLDWRASFWDYLYLNIAPGFHLLYQDADRFNYLNLGIAGYLSVELPIAYHWTIAVGGQASYDWGNFGNNSLLETYDHVWQAGVNLGIRYSGKHVNKYNYVGESAELLQLKKDRKNAIKAEKKAKTEAKKAAAAERKAAEKESQ